MDELGKAFPAAEGMVDAEQSTRGGHHNETCLNCGTKLIDTFCQHCGQKDIPRRQTLGELLTNFISSFWSYEGKFFLTTKYLVTRPGFLAVEYNAGRRESYYHPARMYVFISFVFFLIFFSIPDSDENQEMTREDIKELNRKLSPTQMDSLIKTLPLSLSDTSIRILTPAMADSIQDIGKKRRRNKGNDNGVLKNGDDFLFSDKKEWRSLAAYDSSQRVLPEDKRDNWAERGVIKRTIELQDRYKGDIRKFGKDFVALLKDNFSKILFWLLPFFALLLKLLYVRRDFYYSEHLVFTIYYYNFFYLAASIQLLVNLVPWLEWLSTIITFWIILYLLFAMKRMYNQSWRKTIFKYVLFSFTFSFLILIAFTITALAVFMVL